MKAIYFFFIFTIYLIIYVISQNEDLQNHYNMDLKEKDKLLSCIQIVNSKIDRSNLNVCINCFNI